MRKSLAYTFIHLFLLPFCLSNHLMLVEAKSITQGPSEQEISTAVASGSSDQEPAGACSKGQGDGDQTAELDVSQGAANRSYIYIFEFCTIDTFSLIY
jgi:hypothetical protein